MYETLLTVPEVAEWLKVNPQTVRNWIDRGELPAVRVGARRVRIKKSDLENFMAAASPLPAEPVTDPVPTADEADGGTRQRFAAALATVVDAGIGEDSQRPRRSPARPSGRRRRPRGRPALRAGLADSRRPSETLSSVVRTPGHLPP
jgi:excisionase family DNA binding protein